VVAAGCTGALREKGQGRRAVNGPASSAGHALASPTIGPELIFDPDRSLGLVTHEDRDPRRRGSAASRDTWGIWDKK
jgi:hypothetical protein